MGVSVLWEALVERTEMAGCSKCICDTLFCVWFLSLPQIHVTFPSLSAPDSPRTANAWVSLKSEQSHYSPFTILWDWCKFEHHHGVGLQKQRGSEWHHKGRATVALWCCIVLLTCVRTSVGHHTHCPCSWTEGNRVWENAKLHRNIYKQLQSLTFHQPVPPHRSKPLCTF